MEISKWQAYSVIEKNAVVTAALCRVLTLCYISSLSSAFVSDMTYPSKLLLFEVTKKMVEQDLVHFVHCYVIHFNIQSMHVRWVFSILCDDFIYKIPLIDCLL